MRRIKCQVTLHKSNSQRNTTSQNVTKRSILRQHQHTRTFKQHNEHGQVVELLFGVAPHFQVPVHRTEQVQHTLQCKKLRKGKVALATPCVASECQNDGVDHAGNGHCADACQRLQTPTYTCERHCRVVTGSPHERFRTTKLLFVFASGFFVYIYIYARGVCVARVSYV